MLSIDYVPIGVRAEALNGFPPSTLLLSPLSRSERCSGLLTATAPRQARS
jgi:hypothetical protein